MSIYFSPAAATSAQSLDLILAMDATKFHETATILLQSITDNDLIEVGDQIRNIAHCSTGFQGLKPPVRGCVVLWAQLQDAGNHATKIKLTRELKGLLLYFALHGSRAGHNGGFIQVSRTAAPGGPKVNVVFMFEYKNDDHLPQIREPDDEHKDLFTILKHRPKQF